MRVFVFVCMCLRERGGEREKMENVAFLPVPLPPANPRAADSGRFAESNNFTQLLEEEMN